MSLINDALKRAAEAEKRQTGTRPRRRGPKGAEALGPMVHTKPVTSRRDMLSISPAFGLIMLIILMAGLSSFLLHNWWTKHRKFKLVVPPGMDPLEAMIVHDPRLDLKRPDGPVVVTQEGVKGTETSATNNVAAATPTNTVAEPSTVGVAQNTETNSAPDAPTTDPLPPGPLIAAATTNAPLPVLPAPPTRSSRTETTNAISAPVKIAAPPPTPEGPVIVRARPFEGSKTQEQIDAELAARERAMMNASTHAGGPIVTGPQTVAKPKVEFPEINVIGIMLKQDSATAYVNGKIITLGDVVNGAELIEISKEYLTFAMRGAEQKYFIAQ